MNCLNCATYQATKGRGGKGCVKCAAYREFQKTYSLRNKIPFVSVSDEILENIEDTRGAAYGDMVEAIQKMPIEMNMTLTLYYVSRMSKREIARLTVRSEKTVRRMIASGERLLEKMLRG